VFKMLDSLGETTAGSEHGPTLASSVVADEEKVARRNDAWF